MSLRPLFPACGIAFLAGSCGDPAEPANVPPTAEINTPGQDTTVIWPYSVTFETGNRSWTFRTWWS